MIVCPRKVSMSVSLNLRPLRISFMQSVFHEKSPTVRFCSPGAGSCFVLAMGGINGVQHLVCLRKQPASVCGMVNNSVQKLSRIFTSPSPLT